MKTILDLPSLSIQAKSELGQIYDNNLAIVSTWSSTKSAEENKSNTYDLFNSTSQFGRIGIHVYDKSGGLLDNALLLSDGNSGASNQLPNFIKKYAVNNYIEYSLFKSSAAFDTFTYLTGSIKYDYTDVTVKFVDVPSFFSRHKGEY